MRTLLVGALIASLMGCCRTPPQAALERCTTKGCIQRTVATSQTEIRRVAFKSSPAPAEIKSTSVAAPAPAQEPGDFGKPEVFVPQKVRAKKRFLLLAGAAVIGTLAGIVLLLAFLLW